MSDPVPRALTQAVMIMSLFTSTRESDLKHLSHHLWGGAVYSCSEVSRDLLLCQINDIGP